MGSACCGRNYEGNERMLLKRKRGSSEDISTLLSPPPELTKNYIGLPNRFEHQGSASICVGLAGIENLGNTCYISSALQCILNTQPLIDYFLAGVHEDEINPKFSGELTRSFVELAKAQWLSEYESIVPRYLINLVWETAAQFEAGKQNDCHEFLSYFLDQIHEELNRVARPGTPSVIENNGEKDERQAAKAWHEYLSYNCSVIVDLFQGQLKSTLKCSECGFISATFDVFMYLSVPIAKKSCTLEDCLLEFTKEEILDGPEKWFCPCCNQKCKATKKFDLWKLPPVLIIHLKRFKYNKCEISKLESFVKYPTANLNLTKYILSNQKEPPNYDLFGTINHSGTNQNGHYTATCKNKHDQKWYHYDDEKTKRVNLEETVTRNAYVLFYFKNSIDQFFTQSSRLPEYWPHILSKDITVNNTENDEQRSSGLATDFPNQTAELGSFNTIDNPFDNNI
ncbi:unnamed protein product [Blepharisma stoltei]|uniref:Ubiquitin carboxyl-terminal hydrolase n=1 Tax=Blepharisma stoltei TaxID=1481888 RepID=A0AAU9KH57_9CILI|nr:unnamed protein product [Blepharisma stoltei]